MHTHYNLCMDKTFIAFCHDVWKWYWEHCESTKFCMIETHKVKWLSLGCQRTVWNCCGSYRDQDETDRETRQTHFTQHILFSLSIPLSIWNKMSKNIAGRKIFLLNKSQTIDNNKSRLICGVLKPIYKLSLRIQQILDC